MIRREDLEQFEGFADSRLVKLIKTTMQRLQEAHNQDIRSACANDHSSLQTAALQLLEVYNSAGKSD